ncbi:hypothetical protein ACUFKU_003629, partial [Vibrio cholerae]
KNLRYFSMDIETIKIYGTVFFLVMLGFKKIKDVIFDFKTSKFKVLEQALSSGCLSELDKEYIKSIASKEQFRLATGLDANERFRRIATEIDLDDSIDISMRQIALSKKFLKIIDGKIKVAITKKEMRKAKIDMFFGGSEMVISCVLIFSSLPLALYYQYSDAVFSLCIGLYFGLLGIVTVLGSRAAFIAMKIESELEKFS